MSVTLIVGDVHLGKGLGIGKPGIGNALNSRIVDQMRLLDWVLDQATSTHAGAIILTGDICEDPKPDYILIELFIGWLKRCESSNIEVHIIAGNHDIKRTGSHYKSFLDLITAADLPRVRVYKYTNTILRKDVGFTLLPFRDKAALNCTNEAEAFYKISSQLPYELGSIPNGYDRVLVGHLALKGSLFVGDEFDNLANELMCPLDMFSGYDYVWMGHVHKPQVRRKKPHIAHIGSMDISDFGETDHKKIIIIFDTCNPKKFTEVEIPTRPLRRIRMDIPVDFDPTSFVIDQANAMHQQDSFEGAIVKLELKLLDGKSKGVDRKKIRKAIYDLGAFHICNLSESKNVSVVPITTQHNIDSKIDKKAAVKIWAESDRAEMTSEDEKNGYIDLAHKYIDKFHAKQNKK
jgi:exonuclease SbcD